MSKSHRETKISKLLKILFCKEIFSFYVPLASELEFRHCKKQKTVEIREGRIVLEEDVVDLRRLPKLCAQQSRFAFYYFLLLPVSKK